MRQPVNAERGRAPTTNRAALFAAMAAAFTMLVPTAAHAYIGPGAGLGAIAVAVAVVLGLVLLVVGLVWYPLKRMIKGNRNSVKADDGPDGQ